MPLGFHMGILLPLVEVAVHVVDVHMNDSAFHFDIHGLFICESMITPLCEVAMKSLAKSIADHVSSSVLMSPSHLVQFVSVERSSISNSNIHFVFNSSACQLIL